MFFFVSTATFSLYSSFRSVSFLHRFPLLFIAFLFTFDFFLYVRLLFRRKKKRVLTKLIKRIDMHALLPTLNRLIQRASSCSLTILTENAVRCEVGPVPVCVSLQLSPVPNAVTNDGEYAQGRSGYNEAITSTPEGYAQETSTAVTLTRSPNFGASSQRSNKTGQTKGKQPPVPTRKSSTFTSLHNSIDPKKIQTFTKPDSCIETIRSIQRLKSVSATVDPVNTSNDALYRDRSPWRRISTKQPKFVRNTRTARVLFAPE